MICPKCEYEYLEGITTCPDCGSELVNKEDFEENLTDYSDWIVIHTTYTKIDAEMFAANLEGADIDVKIIDQSDKVYPLVGNLSVVKIMVKKSDTEEAMKIINDIRGSN